MSRTLPTITNSDSSDQPDIGNHDIAYMLPTRSRRQWNCAERHCSCSCHLTARSTRRFWRLEYIPLGVVRQICDQQSCNATKYGGAFSFALSQLGISWSAMIQFHVISASGRLSLRPSLEVERIVPYTHPGFETLWRCENQMITFEEARDKLVELHHSDPTFKTHVNPEGKSYIEVRYQSTHISQRTIIDFQARNL